MKFINTGKSVGNASDATWKVNYKNGAFYSFTPNSVFEVYHPEYKNTIHINTLGGRATVANERADTANLIPFTGDSFVMGVGVEDTENVVALEKKHLNYNFLNLGIGGSCLPIQREIINRRYNELGKPSVVIYGFFLGNDYDDIIKESYKKRDLATQFNDSSAQPAENGFFWRLNYFINHNTIFKRLYVLQFLKQKILNIKNKGNSKDMDPIFYMINTTNTDYINKAKEKLIVEIEVLSKEPYHSIIVIIPDRYQVNDEIRKSMLAYYNINEKNILQFLPNNILIEILKKYQIPFIDATQCLTTGQKQQKNPLYYTQDNHFTKLGQEIFSNCIKDSLAIMIKNLQKNHR